MKLIAATFDEDENPATFTITMSVAEAAGIYQVFGFIPSTVMRETYGVDYETSHEICHVADYFNSYYDDGVNDYLKER